MGFVSGCNLDESCDNIDPPSNIEFRVWVYCMVTELVP